MYAYIVLHPHNHSIHTNKSFKGVFFFYFNPNLKNQTRSKWILKRSNQRAFLSLVVLILSTWCLISLCTCQLRKSMRCSPLPTRTKMEKFHITSFWWVFMLYGTTWKLLNVFISKQGRGNRQWEEESNVLHTQISLFWFNLARSIYTSKLITIPFVNSFIFFFILNFASIYSMQLDHHLAWASWNETGE